MKTCLVLILSAFLASCATGESFRTTMPDGTKYEAKRTGLWFAGKVAPLVHDEPLEIK
ncbi:MAG: hypothetical protein ACRD0K_17815 [Egibacteraceae bacterium]